MNGGISAVLSSEMGYVGPHWDVRGQPSGLVRTTPGVTSVPGGSMRNPGRRRPPLPAGLTQPEREFFLELRRLTDVAGFTYRALEERTSAFKPAADPCFYGKSQWGRWLNGQSMPPRNAVRRLAEILAAEGITAGHLLDLWSRTFMSVPTAEAEPAGSQAADSQRLPAVAPVVLQPAELPSPTWAGALVGRDSEMALLTGLIRQVCRGRGGSVLVEGEPGIGKSALVRAAVAEAPEAGCQVFWGAGDELGQGLPLLPFLDGPQWPAFCGRRGRAWLGAGETPRRRLNGAQVDAIVRAEISERQAAAARV
jgi:hypothetical protein